MNCSNLNVIDRTDFQMIQGDTYALPIKLMHKGLIIENTVVRKIVFQFGTITKEYPSQDVSYRNQRFVINFTQAETLQLKSELYMDYQASVLFEDGSRKSTKIYSMQILKTLIRREIFDD